MFEDFYKSLNQQLKLSSELIIKPLRESVKNSLTAISKIKLPKIDFDIDVAYENIEILTRNNSSYGWTAHGQMNALFYLDEDLLDKSQEYIDSQFLDYFESDSRKNLYRVTDEIKEVIDDKWKDVINDCFDLYETEKYRVIIPMLISIIEGEVSEIAESQKVGNRLMEDWEKKILTEEDRMMVIASYSLQEFLSSNMFKYRDFKKERAEVLNRNWVLHGRDNPKLWTRIDALKLINIIATLQFIRNS